MCKTKIKIISIDPGTKHMGFASFEGIELIDYGVKIIKQGSVDIILEHVEEIISRMIDEKKPDYLVLEKNAFSQSKSNLRLAMVVAKIKKIAKKKGLLVYEYDPRTIRKEICNDGNASKKRVAQTLIIFFPDLKVYLKSDKDWVLKYQMNMFDAVAVGMTFLRINVSSILPIQKWQLAKSTKTKKK